VVPKRISTLSRADQIPTIEKQPIIVKRPLPIDNAVESKSPFWTSKTQYCTTCPRDVMITIGNRIYEAPMSKRSRFFEYLAYRNITLDLWKQDRQMKWCVAPKPSMSDEMYDTTFWQITEEERIERMKSNRYVVKNDEPVFDAADIMRVGKDIFIQESMTTNRAGIDWLQRELHGHVRVHTLHFPHDMYPTHIDASFIPLRPPTNGSPGLVLINPERPPVLSEVQMWLDNDWQFIVAPQPATWEIPAFSPCSKWLSMNLLSISPKTVIIEENEIPLYELLTDYGFDVITVPFRHVFEFGGAIHCSTWDIRRNDSCGDYFPDTSSFDLQYDAHVVDVHNRSHLSRNAFGNSN